MPGHNVVSKSSTAQHYHFVLRTHNKQVILVSETYSAIQAALNGIASCRANSRHDARDERKTSAAAQPYSFVLKAGNGEVIGGVKTT
jgi:uncharacterized protein YegP (UPF0339 family)